MDQIPSDATKEGATPRELMNMLCGRNAAIHDDIINFAWVRPSAPAPSPPAPLPLGEGGRRPGEGVTKLTTLCNRTTRNTRIVSSYFLEKFMLCKQGSPVSIMQSTPTNAPLHYL